MCVYKVIFFKYIMKGVKIMKYIVLLRGINISGKNKIAMNLLKKELESLGYKNVITYLNSGNIILDSEELNNEKIVNDINLMIKDRFNLDIPVFVIGLNELGSILDNSPNWWGSDNKEIYDNLIFMFPNTNYDEVFNEVGEPTENIDMIENYKNVIFWSFDLRNYRKSNWWIKTASCSIKDKITIRTANTIRKVYELASKK